MLQCRWNSGNHLSCRSLQPGCRSLRIPTSFCHCPARRWYPLLLLLLDLQETASSLAKFLAVSLHTDQVHTLWNWLPFSLEQRLLNLHAASTWSEIQISWREIKMQWCSLEMHALQKTWNPNNVRIRIENTRPQFKLKPTKNNSPFNMQTAKKFQRFFTHCALEIRNFFWIVDDTGLDHLPLRRGFA